MPTDASLASPSAWTPPALEVPVLVAGDAYLCHALARTLNELGASVSTATGLGEALRALWEGGCVAVFAGEHLGTVAGTDFLREVGRRHARVMRVLVSGRYRLGADGGALMPAPGAVIEKVVSLVPPWSREGLSALLRVVGTTPAEAPR